jgi:uncharacterized membrane protein
MKASGVATVYFVLKLIHIAAVIVFLGNVSIGIFWKSVADRTADPRIMAHTVRGIIKADRWFTIPAIIVLLMAGFATAGAGRIPILGTGWILWSLILFTIAGIAFGPVSRVQRQLAALASAASGPADFDAAGYRRLSGVWNAWGLIALIAPVMALIFMVLKPALPAFQR